MVRKILMSGMLDKYNNMIIVLPRKLENNFSSNSFRKSLFYDVDPTKYNFFFTYFNLAFSLYKQIPTNKTDILTAANHGPFFNAMRVFHRGKVILFEDGISTYLNIKKRLSVWRKEKFLHSKNYDYALLEKNSDVFIPQSCKNKIRYFDTVESQLFFNNKRNYFVSSPSVEYGLETIDSYANRVINLRELLGDESFYISFKHNETCWREKLKIFKSHFDSVKVVKGNVALETIMKEASIGILVASYNTSAMNVVRYFGCDRMILFDDSGPNMSERIDFFKSVKTPFPITHISKNS